MTDYLELVKNRLEENYKDSPMLDDAVVLVAKAFDSESAGGKTAVQDILKEIVRKLTEGTVTELEAIESLLEEV
ncbi:MAG: hypothetical protein E3J35_09320 [Methanomassiliicoccales archaeon]|nr:MAG: hypothetical protein E3J35_09320 [Methanomassiliicoccales archaeon]